MPPGSDLRLGILGVSHGHPYSISAFCNGYVREGLKEAYPNIVRYLEAQPPENRRFPGARVVSIWAGDRRKAEHTAWIGRIPHVADRPEELLDGVDGVLVTENEGDTHLPLARPFLERGIPIFFDRPLVSRWETMRQLWSEAGEDYPLMSCSNLRYNPVLRELKAEPSPVGTARLFRGLSAMDWFGYGWHMGETLVQLWGREPVSVRFLGEPGPLKTIPWRDGAGYRHQVQGGDWSVGVTYPDRRLALLQVLCPLAKTLEMSLHGTVGHLVLPAEDPFFMMRSLLGDFVSMVRTGRRPVELMKDTVAVCRIMIGADISRREGGRRVRTEDELKL